MAEGSETWWGGWFQSARQKGSDVYDFMKRDLDEFTQTFQEETKNVVSSAAGALREKLQIDDSESKANKMKRSVSTLLGTVTQAFTLAREENEDELCVIHNNEPVLLDRVQSQVYTMQIDPKTYLEDPEPLEEYEKWLRTFDLEQMQSELSDILINNPEVQSLYTKLVPAMVSHIVFWHRYFFKFHQLKESEERKHALLKRADDEKEEIRWDDEDIPSNNEITDQLATQILSNYEAECKERKRSEDGKSILYKLPSSILDSSITNSEHTMSNESKQLSTLSDTPPMTRSDIEEVSTKAPKIENTKLPDESPTKDAKTPERLQKDTNMLTTKDKGDLVVVMKSSSDRISPSSSNKESSNEEEWEKDFELEVNEEDVLAAKKLLKQEGGATSQPELLLKQDL